MIDLVKNKIHASIEVKQRILNNEEILAQIGIAAERVVLAFKDNNKVLIAGNGGSAADAQHISSEFVSKYNYIRAALPCIALTTDPSILTSVSNDFGYERVFARQIAALGSKNDVFIAISTSGTSPNIIEAIDEANKREIFTLGLSGKSGGNMVGICDNCICVPSEETPRIQESHILIGHIICDIVEEALFGKES